MPFWFTALLILIFDQGTKWLIKENMELYQSIPIIPNIFHLTYIENPGAAFGILANQRIFFIIITFIILAFIYYFYRQLKENQVLLKIALGMVVGGALGNLIDRWRSGTVTDFFDFQIWPIFNIADTAVVVAMLYISYKVLTTKEEI
ncbi:MAG: signal peptidase II [Clostridia bacterium]|nr:signal peptidase II [Clostridia bacterium]